MTNLAFVADTLDGFASAITGPIANGAAISPLAATFTLPGNGLWLVAVQYAIQGSQDHMMSGLWLVQYCNAASNKTMLSTQIGATGKSSGSSFGLNSLTLSNPDITGVVTATASWTNGGSHTAGGIFSARKVISL